MTNMDTPIISNQELLKYPTINKTKTRLRNNYANASI